ncbi:CBS domain-containing protein CBSX5 [Acorus calamus]|uniref:CBS domain-containing protein CBSX5 n=1 Tax=Acorus calamus TaxID=4465 RepID=A0AAV9E743_ACOCL|nr:CBS domain-containing protein CBSX5 [Acorus calamus]
MAVTLSSYDVSDLTLGKPSLKSLPITSTVSDAVSSLKRHGDTSIAVLSLSDRIVAKVCMVDVLCFLLRDDINLSDPLSALQSPLSALLSKPSADLVRHIDRHASLLEALDLILEEGAQDLLVPIRQSQSNRKNNNNNHHHHHCWLTQEDVTRFLLNSIGSFSPLPALSVSSLGLVDPAVLTVGYHDPSPAVSALLPLSLANQTAIAVVTSDHKLIGEISPSTLANLRDPSVAAAIATLSAGELMAYIDCGGPPDDIVRAVKNRLSEKGLNGLLDLLEESMSATTSSSSCSSGSSSSSDDDGEGVGRGGRRTLRRRRSSGSYSARMARGSEAIVCHPWSSLVAVMMQALAHRVGYVWVVEDDFSLAGIVTFRDILRVFMEHLE